MTGSQDGYEKVWFHLTDAQFSTVAIIDANANVAERVTYTAYGRARHHWFEDVDGDHDTADLNLVSSLAGKRIQDVGYRAEADLDRDGIISRRDYGLANSSDPLGTGFGHAALAEGVLSSAAVDNQIGWDGYVFNAEVETYTVRFRTYGVVLARWLERDPLMYVDGMSLYEYVRSHAVSTTDPMGLQDPGWVRLRERQMLDQLRQRGNLQSGGSSSGSASSWVVDALLKIQQYAGTEQNFQCCSPTPGGMMACIIVTLSGDLQTCCKNGRRNVCVRIELSVSGGLYAPGSVTPGCTFEPKTKNWKKPISPGQIRRGPGAALKVPLRHGFNSACPKEGLSGRVCITGSAGYRSWTVGARGCLNFPGAQPTLDAGLGIGYGTGIAIEGGGTYIKCGLDIEKYYPSP